MSNSLHIGSAGVTFAAMTASTPSERFHRATMHTESAASSLRDDVVGERCHLFAGLEAALAKFIDD